MVTGLEVITLHIDVEKCKDLGRYYVNYSTCRVVFFLYS
jgi:hypothetical protein